MRMLMKWTLGTREASEALRDGRMVEINKALDELTKPEAQYFCTEGGSSGPSRSPTCSWVAGMANRPTCCGAWCRSSSCRASRRF